MRDCKTGEKLLNRARPLKPLSLIAAFPHGAGTGVQGWAMQSKVTAQEGAGPAQECSLGVKLQGFNQQMWKSPPASPSVSVSVCAAIQSVGFDFEA